MKIMFAFYPHFVAYNHGISLLSALCKERGIEVSLCILSDVEAMLHQIEMDKPDVVGFSCVTIHDYRNCLPFIREAKVSGKIILLGGVWAGFGLPVDPAVDYVCRGDGEALPDFLLNGDTRVFERRMVCPNIHNLPLPDYELFRDIPFDRGFSCLKGKKVLPYYSSRGCNGSCSFCQVRHQPKGVRIRARIKEDLITLDAYGSDIYFMGDAGLPHLNVRWRESWEDYGHPFFAYIRADIKPSSLEFLISRGMTCCAFGVEAADEQYRNTVLRKNLSNDEILRTVDILYRNDVAMVSFFMADTPGETPEQREQTFAMSKAMPGQSFVFSYEELGVCA
jgi:radical SAM superfamily enzyme YgiQ (UPF0313 family)